MGLQLWAKAGKRMRADDARPVGAECGHHNVILEPHEHSALVQIAQGAVELDLGLGGVFPFSIAQVDAGNVREAL
jgi:hypothetical protein